MHERAKRAGPTSPRALGVRWTIGDVSVLGFEALRLSIHGATRIFGRHARYVVCVNSVPLELARERTGPVPDLVEWRDVTRELDPAMRRHFDEGLAEGVGWKFAPLRVFEDRHELALDNDCILWGVPIALRAWLAEDDPGTCVIAEDVRACFGQFAEECGDAPRNTGIRGVPPGFDLRRAMEAVLARRPALLRSELDEQGLQVAALTSARRTLVVSLADVSICSPFPPHRRELGRCGAHFVGLNAHRLSWTLEDGRNACEETRAHFARLRPLLYERVGLATPPPQAARAWPAPTRASR